MDFSLLSVPKPSACGDRSARWDPCHESSGGADFGKGAPRKSAAGATKLGGRPENAGSEDAEVLALW